MKDFLELKGDASFRKFFRKKNKNFNSIFVFSKKNKYKNLLVYDAVNKILKQSNVLAPKTYQENYKKDYIEIEDFGDDTIYKILIKKKSKKFFYFKKIILLLNKIQSIKKRNIQDFRKKLFRIPTYDIKILKKEANLFCDWYVKKNLSKKDNIKFKKNFNKVIKKLLKNLKLKNNTFVHRDFHISNLMLVNKKIGVIDSQDALIGNQAYDLASLIDDVRYKTSKSLKEKIFNFYIKKQKKLNIKKFKNDFNILSVLRNLKIIGIFTRLAIRDNKRIYLRLIPHAWFLINLRICENGIFEELKGLLKKNFKDKIK